VTVPFAPTLTSLLGNRTSQLSQFLDAEFPHTLAFRRSVREACGPIRFEPGAGRDGGAIGAAFDLLATFAVTPDAVILDREMSLTWTANHAALTEEMLGRVASGISTRSTELYEAVWVLGLLVNSIRSFTAYMSSPITGLVREALGLDEVLAGLPDLIPEGGLAELRQLDELAATALYPKLTAPVYFHPWLGNDVMQAEADIIAGGVLIDVKTNRGEKTAAGFRWLPSLADVYQVIVYALLNHLHGPESYGQVNTVGFYAARYGALITHPLQELLDQLAGAPVDVDSLARAVILHAQLDD
jgi:hypothetical protein